MFTLLGGERKKKWDTLEHNGPMFPPEYKPHNLPIIYNGEKIKVEKSQPKLKAKIKSNFIFKTKAKRKTMKAGRQFSKQPKHIADKVRQYRNEWKIDNKIKHGSYTKPNLRRKLFIEIKAANTHGTQAGKWAARKAQLLAKKYKALGGGYY